jgi:hypothetical protein
MKLTSLALMGLLAVGASSCTSSATPASPFIDVPLEHASTPSIPPVATTIIPQHLPDPAEALILPPPGVALTASLPTATAQIDPNTPEDVVQSFLLASQIDPGKLPAFLGTGLRDQLSGADPMTLLHFAGEVEGYAVQSGSVVLGDSPSAIVKVGLQIAGSVTQRIFILGKEGDRWVITGIEVE